MRMGNESCAHIFVALQTGGVGIHLRFQLGGARPRSRIGLSRGIEMHFVAADAGEFAAAKTRRSLHSVKFPAGHAHHSVAPEPVLKKIRLGAADELLLFRMVRRVWLNDEALDEIVSAGTESRAVAIKIDLVGHIVERPDAVTLTAGERRLGTIEAGRVGHGWIELRREVKLETTDRITIALDVFAPLAVARLARDPEFSDA